MAIELTKDPTDAERMFKICMGYPLPSGPEFYMISRIWIDRASEFAAPYLARVAELEPRAPANSCTNAEREQYEHTIELQNARIAELDAALHALHKIGYDPTDETSARAWRNAGKVLSLKAAQ